ncbi:VanZ like family protein [Sarcina sp. DSM 11001]|uniref:VanZ family protein n=1 Tax=Sarcina sp. DSM 11001 TaxID=1798184 RepID=UPI000891CD3E|nr:VanZ family protein [Sarcina sp. DSM 11001]SDK24604.1 VanZ like family protein [Sarcina sp. DSM 11001]
MSKANIAILIRIALSAFAVFGFPHLLKAMHVRLQEKWRKKINIVSLLGFLICVWMYAFIFRSEINGTGVIIDPLWAFRQIFRRMASGYKEGGIAEAVRRISWVRDTVASLLLNILFLVPFGYLVPCTFRHVQSWREVLTLAILFSLGIETIQYFTQRGWFDIADLIYNSGGALIGYSLYRRLLHEI